MILSKDIPEKIDVFEYLLPKLQLMTMPPSFEGDTRSPEVRFINFLQELSIDSDKIKELDNTIEQWNIKTAHEFDLMKRRAEGFLEMYATDYNKYFKTTKNYQTQASRMQAFMAKLYTIFTDTSKKERARAYDEDFNRIFHSAFENSPLNAPYIEATWLDLNSLTMEAKLLFSHLQNLFLNLQKMFEYAQNVDNLVEGLRKDRKRIVAIFNKCNQKKKNDRQIGRFMDGLEKLGLAENTIVIFTSDNGAYPTFNQVRSNGHRGSKNSIYEGGVNMPFIIVWPNKIKAGGVDDESVINAVDIYPSLCAITGAKQIAGFNYSGEDMSKALLGIKHQARQKDMMWDFGRNRYFNRPAQVHQQSPHLGIRRGDWKVLVNGDGTNLELFNIKEDPNETTNIADRHPELASEMSKKVINWYYTKRKVRGEN